MNIITNCTIINERGITDDSSIINYHCSVLNIWW